MMRRVCSLLVVGFLVGAVAGALASCGTHRGLAPYQTSLPSQNLGLRVTDGKLRFWTGSPCPGTTYAEVGFVSPDGEQQISTPTQAPAGDTRIAPGVQLEYFTLDDPPPGFQVTKALPPGFDWRVAHYFLFNVYGPEVARGVGMRDFTHIAREIIDHSAEHPEDTYFFPDLGWLSRADVAAKDGKEFMTVCTPDPARQESRIATVGVRVTDGTLRFWTGPPCPVADAVFLTFQPGQTDVILTKGPHSTGFEYLTLDGANPEFTVYRPLPAGFDWRTAKSVLVRLIGYNQQMVWSKTTDLAIPIAESAQHPPDTYYFEGVGWLDHAEVLDRDGTSLTTICGKTPH